MGEYKMDRIMQQFGWLKLGHASYFFVASWFGKKNHCFFQLES